MTNAFGPPVDESGGRFRRVVNNDEKCVPLSRANHVQFHGGIGRGKHSFAAASTLCSTRQFQALLASEQIPRFRSGVCMHWDNGFRAEVCLIDDDLVAGPRGNRREVVCLRDERPTFRPTSLGGEGEEPDLACCFHYRTRGSCGTLRGLFRREILEPPNKRTGRQDRKLGVYKNGAIRVGGPLSWNGRLVAVYSAMFMANGPIRLSKHPPGAIRVKQIQAESIKRGMHSLRKSSDSTPADAFQS